WSEQVQEDGSQPYAMPSVAGYRAIPAHAPGGTVRMSVYTVSGLATTTRSSSLPPVPVPVAIR
ncbi:MAG TPA: hypothetical protein VKP13_18095, partial [Nitrospira sp.]|nr:hypothetical protein [Nitrospira sp.]